MHSRNGSLDILRAAAIGLVLACHFVNKFAEGSLLAAYTGVGGRGVDLFFVLSGWLLGGQLFRERLRTGRIDVRRFWFRRWLRTLPAYFVVLSAAYAQQAAKGRADETIFLYLIFVQNYLDYAPFFGVSWSLCVEEYFYLAVAPLAVLAGRSRTGLAVVAVVLALVLAFNAAVPYFAAPGSILTSSSTTHMRFPQCLMGVLLAWLCVCRPRAWAVACRFALPLALVGLGFFVLGVLNAAAWSYILPDWGILGWGLIFTSWVLLANAGPFWENLHAWPTRYLAHRAYALYLTHGEAIALVRRVPGLSPAAQIVLAAVVALAVAELLYQFVERPGMNLRNRFRATA